MTADVVVSSVPVSSSQVQLRDLRDPNVRLTLEAEAREDARKTLARLRRRRERQATVAATQRY